jgi:hypothetical protein
VFAIGVVIGISFVVCRVVHCHSVTPSLGHSVTQALVVRRSGVGSLVRYDVIIVMIGNGRVAQQ